MKGCTPLPSPSAVLRDPAVDLLRFIGISMIFLAHIGPPAALFQLRSFDVPLMIFVSGLSYSGRQVVGYASFVRKRLGRLLMPPSVVVSTEVRPLLSGAQLADHS